jgi:lysophospholipid acyltransferase 1/2
VSVGSQRTKFYIAWLLGDAVNNASGFGFNGYDKNGRAKWNLVTNIHIIAIEVTKNRPN